MFFSRVAAIFALAAAVTAQQVPVPTFTRVLDGIVISDANRSLTGTTGTSRLLVNFVEGNFTDPATGELAATIVPGIGGDQGYLASDGDYFFPQGNMAIQFANDSSYAFMQYIGVGFIGVGDNSYVHFETDSEQYSYLNSKYLILGVNATNPAYATLGLFSID